MWEVVGAASSFYDQNPGVAPERLSSRVTDARVRMARVDPFHIPSDPSETQDGFGPFVGPFVNDKLLEANRTYIHHQKTR